MLRLMNRYRAELGVEATVGGAGEPPPARPSGSSNRTPPRWRSIRSPLRTACWPFDVRVRNLTGHKFPTGYPSRRAWLHVAARDKDGRATVRVGARHRDRTDRRATTAMPLRRRSSRTTTEITRPDEVQIYESIMGTPAGTPTTGLLQATRYLKDNRLLPRGFDKRTAAPEIAVVGAAAADEDFTGDGDRVRYRFPAASRRTGRGRIAISADRLSLGAESGALRGARAARIRELLRRHGGELVSGGGESGSNRGAVVPPPSGGGRRHHQCITGRLTALTETCLTRV